MAVHPLGRRTPSDYLHVDKYPYSTVAPGTVPSVEKILKLPVWHHTHDQGREGSCVGHGTAMERAITNTAQNRIMRVLRPTRRYSALTIWDSAKQVDGDPQTVPGDANGTTVRAAYDVLRTQGACIERKAYFDAATDKVIEVAVKSVSAAEGIAANRWATTVDELRTAIGQGKPVAIGVDWYSAFDVPVVKGKDWWVADVGAQSLGAIRGGHCVCLYGASDRRESFKLKNSWGRVYPEVWLPYSTMAKLLADGGEACLVADR